MDYSKIQKTDKAYGSFLTQQIRKPELTIFYYGILISKKRYDFAYLGYETNTDGYFGIHYDFTKNHYYFGTRNKKMPSTLIALTYPQINEIPEPLKTIFTNVANSRMKVSVKKPE